MSPCLILASLFLTKSSSGDQATFVRIFTAFAIHTEISRRGICVNDLTPQVSIDPVYSITESKTATTDLSRLRSHLGLAACSDRLDENTPAPSGLLSDSPLNPLPASIDSIVKAASKSSNSNLIQLTPSRSTSSSSTTTQSTLSRSISKGPSRQTKVAIAIGVPVVALLSLAVAFLVRYRHRKIRLVSPKKTKAKQEGKSQEDVQPYLQQKAELEVEESRIHELEALERRIEIGNEGERFQLPGNEEDIIRGRQELRGEEHSKELGVFR